MNAKFEAGLVLGIIFTLLIGGLILFKFNTTKEIINNSLKYMVIDEVIKNKYSLHQQYKMHDQDSINWIKVPLRVGDIQLYTEGDTLWF
jgi:hypothetical protein